MLANETKRKKGREGKGRERKSKKRKTNEIKIKIIFKKFIKNILFSNAYPAYTTDDICDTYQRSAMNRVLPTHKYSCHFEYE